jgi:CRP-like cAMP-binding protein
MEQNQLSPETIAALQVIGRQVRYSRGETIFHDGDVYRGVFHIQKGRVKVYNVNEEGKETIMNILRAGDWIAAPTAFQSTPAYHASCECLEDCEVLNVPVDKLHSFLLERPTILFQFTTMIASAAIAFRERIRALTLMTVQERLIAFLRELGAEQTAVSLPIAKNQIASLIGSTPESVSRALRSLMEEGRLTVTGDQYRLAPGKAGSNGESF